MSSRTRRQAIGLALAAISAAASAQGTAPADARKAVQLDPVEIKGHYDNSVGASVHNALAAWWRLPVRERTVQAAGTLLLRGWLTEGFKDDGQAAAWRDRSREMVERYVSGLDPADEPLGLDQVHAGRNEEGLDTHVHQA